MFLLTIIKISTESLSKQVNSDTSFYDSILYLPKSFSPLTVCYTRDGNGSVGHGSQPVTH